MEYTPRRKLTREFKLEAVRQMALSEKPKAQVAQELGVRVGQLRTWRLEFEKEAVIGIVKPDRSAAEDLDQLRCSTYGRMQASVGHRRDGSRGDAPCGGRGASVRPRPFILPDRREIPVVPDGRRDVPCVLALSECFHAAPLDLVLDDCAFVVEKFDSWVSLRSHCK